MKINFINNNRYNYMPNYIIKTINIPAINDTITYYIGKNAIGNFEIIDMANDTDMWFHVADKPSCHVIACLPNKIKRNDMRYIIKIGAMLCKHKDNDIIIYTFINNIKKTDIIGMVNVSNEKIYKG